ncbi:uncharacterized protein LOC132036850 [Lycium ferocissimum]|uniref:uncharacterized protein LOC132036850 n=1 Tax=Lycium ferocissimum TaxID=112874 RepID=UPI0028152B9C|nr:uncharacterized protein LOC132036850 [Lycium ferocissimum]
MALRRGFWPDIRRLQGKMIGPWAIMGDYNYVMERTERIGTPVTMAEIRDMRQCMEECELSELKSSGAYFTWCNKHSADKKVFSRIDRVVTNNDWVIDLPDSEVHFMNLGLYDHSPRIIQWEGGTKQRQPFRYFNMWRLDPEYKLKVQGGWNTDRRRTKMYELVAKLNKLKGVLKGLNKTNFSEVEQKADHGMQALQNCQTQVQSNPLDVALILEEKRLAQECRKWNKARDMYLRQKSKVQWLTQGDQNTKFFPATLKARRNANRVFTIKDGQGQ